MPSVRSGRKFSARDDLTGQAIDLITLRRRPSAKILDALQEAEPQDLRILPDPDQIYRVLARRHRIASGKLQNLARTILELCRTANDAIDNALAFREIGACSPSPTRSWGEETGRADRWR